MFRLERVASRAARSLGKQIDLVDRENKEIAKFNTQIDKTTKVRSGLVAASGPNSIAKSLENVLKNKLGGNATPEIQKRLADAKKFRMQFIQSQKVLQKAKSKINVINTRQSLHKKGSLDWLKLEGKKIPLTWQRRRSRASMKASLGARNLSLGYAKQVALGKRGGMANIPAKRSAKPMATLLNLAKISQGASLAIGAVAIAAMAFSKAMRESTSIIQKYAHYSQGALMASMIMQVGEIKRSVTAARSLSAEMLKFAKASNAAKDSWLKTNIIIEKFTLAMGTAGSKLAEFIGQKMEPVSEAFDQLISNLSKMTGVTKAVVSVFAPFLSVLGDAAKLAGWETEKEKQGKRAQIPDARRQILAEQDPIKRQEMLKNSDAFSPLEKQIFGIPGHAPAPIRPGQPNQQPPLFMPIAPGQPGNPAMPQKPMPGQPGGPPKQPQPIAAPGQNNQFDPLGDFFKKTADLFQMLPMANNNHMRMQNNHQMNVVLNEPANGSSTTIIGPGRGWNKNLEPLPPGLA